jgi:phosphoenolpyruvate carboxylase
MTVTNLIQKVELLQKEGKLMSKEDAGTRPLRVVPLFETADGCPQCPHLTSIDLRNAPAVLTQLFQIPWYKQHIQGFIYFIYLFM